MKKLIEEVEGEGLDGLMGERVTLYCLNFIYTGKLIGVNDSFVKLTDCGVVYDTGSHDSNEWSDYQKLPNDWYVQKSAIESFGVFK